MWIRYQPNPINDKVGDCVIRALSLVLNKSWDDTYIELALYGFILKNMPSGNSVWDALLRDHNYIRKVIPDQCSDGRCYTVKDFCIDNPVGVFLLGTGSHAIAVKDGNYMDAWDSGDEIPIYYYCKEE